MQLVSLVVQCILGIDQLGAVGRGAKDHGRVHVLSPVEDANLCLGFDAADHDVGRLLKGERLDACLVDDLRDIN